MTRTCLFLKGTLLVAWLTLIPGLSLLSAAIAQAGLSGSMIIAGNGPELSTIEGLARAFEKLNTGTFVDIQWDENSDPIRMVKSGRAHVAVTGRAAPTLAAIPIGWDGIAVVVYIANPTKEVTTQQVAAMFSGKVKRWAELSGHETAIQLIDRPPNQSIRQSFEEGLGIVGQIPHSAQVIRSEQNAMSTVAGSVSAVAYASLKPALDAVKYGVDVSLLVIDRVEAAEETVKDGRYKLRRPLLLVSRKEPNPLAEAFATFALSQEGQEIVSEMFTPYKSPSREASTRVKTENPHLSAERRATVESEHTPP
jgi:phosphate transport system substrate-binding protein